MDSIKVTLEIPAELATAFTDFLKTLTVMAERKKEPDPVPVVVVDRSQPVEYPTVEEVLDFCSKNSLIVNGTRFYNFYSDRHWHDTNGKELTDWRDRLLLWDDKDREKLGKPPRKAYRPTESHDDTERLMGILDVKKE